VLDAIEDRLCVCVMAGGSGTRFWPLSRTTRPKQLLTLLDGATLLGRTVARVAPLCREEQIFVITAANLVEASREVLSSTPGVAVLGEPVARNTAPCLGVAAIVAAQLRPDAILALLPADHHVADADAFRSALRRAAVAVADGGIATLGIVPTHPETGYGYIEVGRERGDGSSAVVRFVEKPPLEQAHDFVAGGRHLWNGGVFVARADVLLAAVDATLPALATALGPLRDGRSGPAGSDAFAAALEVAFADAPSVSIDHGIMEHRDDLVVVPLSAGWSDVGSWRSARAIAPDADGNLVDGDTLVIDCERSLIVSDGPAVVATADAVLVLPLSRSQDVRAIVAELKRRGRDDLL
jgi:mannose-1-phosphate guanylyltransferase